MFKKHFPYPMPQPEYSLACYVPSETIISANLTISGFYPHSRKLPLFLRDEHLSHKSLISLMMNRNSKDMIPLGTFETSSKLSSKPCPSEQICPCGTIKAEQH